MNCGSFYVHHHQILTQLSKCSWSALLQRFRGRFAAALAHTRSCSKCCLATATPRCIKAEGGGAITLQVALDGKQMSICFLFLLQKPLYSSKLFFKLSNISRAQPVPDCRLPTEWEFQTKWVCSGVQQTNQQEVVLLSMKEHFRKAKGQASATCWEDVTDRNCNSHVGEDDLQLQL